MATASTRKTDRKLGLDARRALGEASGLDTVNVLAHAWRRYHAERTSPRCGQTSKAGDIARVWQRNLSSNQLVQSSRGAS